MVYLSLVISLIVGIFLGRIEKRVSDIQKDVKRVLQRTEQPPPKAQASFGEPMTDAEFKEMQETERVAEFNKM